MDTLYIIIPAYNEAENVEGVISDWYPVVEKRSAGGKSRLVIIDDGSRDNTYALLKEAAKTHPLLQPLTKTNGGHGNTLIFGYKYAIDHNADYIFQTDSDRQTDPREFDQFWEMRTQYDAVLGSRPAREDGNSRKAVEKVLLILLRLFFGVKMPDSNAPFRLMKRELLGKYLKKLPGNYNLPNVMLSTYFVYFKEPVKFVDISFRPRQAGKNSINIKKIVRIGLHALKDFHVLRKEINS